MDKLLEKLKGLAGDAWSDEWSDALKAAGDEAIKAAVASAVDAEKAKRLASTKEAKEAKQKAAELAKQLGAAGQADEALAAAQKAAAEATARVAQLEAQSRARDIADAARSALSRAELEGGAKIPQERLAAALKLLDLDGVDLDDSGAVVGLEAKVDALKGTASFLWAGGAEPQTGNGGKRTGSDPAPKGKRPDDKANGPAAVGRRLAEMAYARQGGRRPEVTSHG